MNSLMMLLSIFYCTSRRCISFADHCGKSCRRKYLITKMKSWCTLPAVGYPMCSVRLWPKQLKVSWWRIAHCGPYLPFSPKLIELVDIHDVVSDGGVVMQLGVVVFGCIISRFAYVSIGGPILTHIIFFSGKEICDRTLGGEWRSVHSVGIRVEWVDPNVAAVSLRRHVFPADFAFRQILQDWTVEELPFRSIMESLLPEEIDANSPQILGRVQPFFSVIEILRPEFEWLASTWLASFLTTLALWTELMRNEKAKSLVEEVFRSRNVLVEAKILCDVHEEVNNLWRR